MEKCYYYEPYTESVLCSHKKTTGYQTFPYHRHNGFEIYLFLSGNIRVYVESHCYEPAPGQMLLIPPTCRHRIISLDNGCYERITLNLKESILEKLSTATTDLSACFRHEIPLPITLSSEEITTFVAGSTALTHALTSREFGADIEVNLWLCNLLLLANRCYQKTAVFPVNLMPPLVKNLMNYIQTNLVNELSLKELEQKFFRNGVSISRQFKKHTGLSLREYILDCRLEVAKDRLLQGHTVSEACYESGFRDYANFIRTFTKKIGISPGRYAKNSK